MCDLERRLQLAMVATIGGCRPAVSAEQVLAALRWRGVPEGAVSVHSFAPEDFLVVFGSVELCDHVAAMPAVLVPVRRCRFGSGTARRMRGWCR
jgi:hypothetical protein